MARVLILAQRPEHLAAAEGEAWLRRELDALEGQGVERVQLTRLSRGSLRWSGSWDWLVEVHCGSSDDACRMLADDLCTGLLGDLRLLGMRPAVMLAEDAPGDG